MSIARCKLYCIHLYHCPPTQNAFRFNALRKKMNIGWITSQLKFLHTSSKPVTIFDGPFLLFFQNFPIHKNSITVLQTQSKCGYNL
jgi:hypothetical protein